MSASVSVSDLNLGLEVSLEEMGKIISVISRG